MSQTRRISLKRRVEAANPYLRKDKVDIAVDIIECALDRHRNTKQPKPAYNFRNIDHKPKELKLKAKERAFFNAVIWKTNDT